TSASPMLVRVAAVAATGQVIGEEPVHLAAKASQILWLSELVKTNITGTDMQGGVTVTYQGRPQDLQVSGGLEEADIGFSAPMYFRVAQPPSAEKQQLVAAVGIMVGIPDEMMAFPTNVSFE